MPFKSQAQIEKFRRLVAEKKMSQATFDEWMSETPKNLPKRVKQKASTKIQTVKTAKVIK